LRRRIDKIDQFYEGIFYPEGGTQQFQNYQPQPVFPIGREGPKNCVLQTRRKETETKSGLPKWQAAFLFGITGAL